MNKLIEYIKNNLLLVLQQIIIFIAAVGISVSPFIVDYNTLPKGYELPKVFFYQIICAVILILSFITGVLKQRNLNKFRLPKSLYAVLIITLLFIISTLLSTHPEIAIWGNSFRLQGVITYLLMIWAVYGVYSNISVTNWHLLSLSLIFSTVIQSATAYNQFTELVRINPNSILEGIWVNGTFGQANWFAGRLLLAIIFSAYYLGLRLHRNLTLRIIFKLYFGILIFLFIAVLGLTQSGWGMVSAAAAIALIVLYEILPKKIFMYFVTFGVVAAAIGAYIFLRTNTEYNLRIDILNSVLTIITQPFNMNQFRIILFGFGFDTLGEVFRDYGLIKGLLVDRAHNFILDIIIQNGFVVLAIFLTLVGKLFKRIFNNNKHRILDFTFIAVFAWMLRSVIHENGIVNLMDFLIFFSVALALSQKALHGFNSINSKKR